MSSSQPFPSGDEEGGHGGASPSSPMDFNRETPEEAWGSLVGPASTISWTLGRRPEDLQIFDHTGPKVRHACLTDEQLETRVKPPSRRIRCDKGGFTVTLILPNDPTIREVVQIVYDYFNTPIDGPFFVKHLGIPKKDAVKLARMVQMEFRRVFEFEDDYIPTVLDFDSDHRYVEELLGDPMEFTLGS
jgi:hypothetical protein